jgi:uncharacterized repeat protein (TIGR01451 family)
VKTALQCRVTRVVRYEEWFNSPMRLGGRLIAPPRTRRSAGRYTAGLAAAVLLFALLAPAARAQPLAIAHWPHSPVSQPLGQPAPRATPSFSVNLRGNFVTTANTLLTCPGNAVTRRRLGRAAEPCENRNNNDENMRYVNVDPSSGHFNSSTATLTLPDGARVVQAYLYWGADLARGINNGAADGAPGGETPWDPQQNPNGTNHAWTTALMRVGSGSYATVDAREAMRSGAWQGIESWYSTPGNRPGFAYQVRADVTPEVGSGVTRARTRRTRSGRAERLLTVTVANVQAGKGYNRHAGWTLLVAYELPSAPWRNLSLYDGFAYVQVQGGEQKVVGPLEFSGFETPASGNVNAHAATWTYEGDREITGDYLALGRLGSSCGQMTHMTDDLNPADNFFNGTISTGGVDLGGRTPQFANQLGFDRDRVVVPEGTIPHEAEGASACLGTVGDTYFFGGIAFDTLIGAPNLDIEKNADKTEAQPGDVVTYRTTVTNRTEADTPTEAATNLVIADPIPSGLDFAGFADNPGGVCSYNADTRIVTCNVGRLDPGEAFSFAYSATVAAAAQGTSTAHLTNVACYQANSERQPGNVFRGCAPESVEVPPNPYADLGVVKTVSDDVVQPGATVTWTLVATNYGPQTSTGFELRDQLPPGVAFVSHTAESPLTCTTPAVGSTGSVVCTAPSVAAGSSLTATITATVPAGTAGGTVLRNITTVNGDQPEPTPDPHPNRDTAVTTVITNDPVPPTPPAPPDPEGPPAPPIPPANSAVLPASLSGTRLSLSKRANAKSVTPGTRVTFRLRVHNVGEARAIAVRVCDRLPRGLALVSAPGFHQSSGQLCRFLGGLAIGKARVVRITARATRSAPPTVTNVATAEARNARSVRARATLGTPSFTG